MQCPKCQYVRTPADTSPEWQCPSCGVVYAKVAASAQGQAAESRARRPRPPPRSRTNAGGGALRQTRLLLWTAVISAALLLPLILSGTHEVLGMIGLATNFLAAVGGASMAGRTMGLSSLERILCLLFSILPVLNALPALLLLTKRQSASEFPLSLTNDETAVLQAGDEALRSVDVPPSLTTVNGFGFKLYGRSGYDPETDSYMTTHYLVALFIPLLPIGRYRVISEDGYRYQFLGRASLRTFDRIHIAIVIAAVLLMVAQARLSG